MSTDPNKAMEFLRKIAFTRVGGSPEEERAASIIKEELESYGLQAEIEEFDLFGYSNERAYVEVDEPYKATYEGSPVGISGTTPKEGIEAPLKFVQSGQPEFLTDVKDCIILASGGGGLKGYEKAKQEGVLARLFIGGAGRQLVNIPMNRCIRDRFGPLPTAYIEYDHALELIKRDVKKVRVFIHQDESWRKSRNVVAEIKGTEKPEEIILVGAHFDSVPKNQGALDNGAGSATIMELARYFSQFPPKRTLRFVWFGSEELGLMGSWAHVEKREDELKKYIFMVNVDVAGPIIGNNSASVMGSEKLVNYLEILGKEVGGGLNPRQSIYSGDCIPVGHHGIPSVTFSRGGGGTTFIHAPGDTIDHIDGKSLAVLGDIVLEFTRRIANADGFPFEREIPDKIKKATREYLERAGRLPEKDKKEDEKKE